MQLYCASAQGGIFQASWSASGAVAGTAMAPASESPRNCYFLAQHPRLPITYAIDLINHRIDAHRQSYDGTFSRVSEQELPPAAPCHLAIDPEGRFLIVAEYHGGLKLCLLDDDGRLGAWESVIHFSGHGPNKERQAGSHPHGVTLGSDGRHAFVPDLGADCIFVLSLDPRAPSLRIETAREIRLRAGAGPRHFTLSPNGLAAAAVNELDNTLTTFVVERATGSLHPEGTFSTLPPDFTGTSWAAEVAFHPGGQACYVSNRGHDSLAIFPFNPTSHAVEAPSWLPAGGQRPAHFAFRPDGTQLFVANEGSDRITIFAVDSQSGQPRQLSGYLSCPSPTCVLPWAKN